MFNVTKKVSPRRNRVILRLDDILEDVEIRQIVWTHMDDKGCTLEPLINIHDWIKDALDAINENREEGQEIPTPTVDEFKAAMIAIGKRSRFDPNKAVVVI